LKGKMSFVWRSEGLAWVPSDGLVGIEGGVVSGVINLESPSVGAPGRRPRHDERYHEGWAFAADDREQFPSFR
jgi:hypothetical protein